MPSTATTRRPRRTTNVAPAVSAAAKVADRRDGLAEAALKTLAERGYANTSLRDIAQNSEYSHGVLHYYFADKTELIIHCVSMYKKRCVHRYDQVTDATSSDDLLARFLAALVGSLEQDSQEQRLWYDMRVQSLFEPAFRDPVAAIDTELRGMVWRILTRYAELRDTEITVDSETAYALFDGCFSHAVQAHLAGEPDATAVLLERITRLMPRLAGA